jgi:hypothetical protein
VLEEQNGDCLVVSIFLVLFSKRSDRHCLTSNVVLRAFLNSSYQYFAQKWLKYDHPELNSGVAVKKKIIFD